MTAETSQTHKVSRGGAFFGFLNQEKPRSILIQSLFIIFLILSIVYLAGNAQEAMDRQGRAFSFAFLFNESFYDISFSLIDYSSTSTHGRAYLVGLLNTLLVASTGIVAATIVGFTLGIMRLSHNWLLSRISYFFVEYARNVPVLLHILLAQAIVFNLPKIRQSIDMGGGFFLNNRGLLTPKLLLEDGLGWLIFASFAVAFGAIYALKRWARRRKDQTGQHTPVLWLSLGLLIFLPLFTTFASGLSVGVETPTLKGFNYKGGIAIRPEFFALWLALSFYTAAFIAEIVRSGILSVSKGQWEAAHALGIKRSTILWTIVIPQALRVIIPPLNSQYLNLTKNSSLGAAIGYMDLMGTTGGVTLNQSGQAFACLLLILATYLTISLIISAVMNIYNRATALKER